MYIDGKKTIIKKVNPKKRSGFPIIKLINANKIEAIIIFLFMPQY